ncbi:MAG: hypothetical protein J1F64_10555, partial [Oscillospiraceae bacterium]|nr:hypothetical protein [Oscillospiraceae bacterium]
AGNNQKTIKECYNTGDVSGSYDTGGIVGMNDRDTSDCYNVGSVNGSSRVGGIVGNNGSSICTLTNCYNIGFVDGTSNVGSIVGSNYNVVSNCYYMSDKNIGGIDGMDSYSQAEVKTKEDFARQRTFENWKFYVIWQMDDFLGRPILISSPEGNGSKDAPYLIPDLPTLERFRDYINGTGDFDGNPHTGIYRYFKLTANIDMSDEYNESNGKSWTPIANRTTTLDGDDDIQFQGDFDGGGHEISGLYINRSTYNDYSIDIGLFGRLRNGAKIRNLKVSGCISYTGNDVFAFIGGIAATGTGTIENCVSNVEISSTGISSLSDYYDYMYEIGGIAGSSFETIKNCTNIGNVSCIYGYAGGITGKGGPGTVIESCDNKGEILSELYDCGGITGNNMGIIKNCTNNGKISGLYYAGGIAGRTKTEWSKTGYIENCYNSADITGNSASSYYVGGIVGDNQIPVRNCYNTGDVSGRNFVGGITGRNDENVTTCYNIGKISGQSNIGGVAGNNNTNGKTASCYYLYNYSYGGINGTDSAGKAERKYLTDFESGAVTWLLQSRQSDKDTQVWGQRLKPEDEKKADDHPLLTSEAPSRVYKITFYTDKNQYYTDMYSNSDGIAELPQVPTGEEWEWFTEDGEEFYANKPITEDTIVVAKSQKPIQLQYGEKDGEKIIEIPYGEGAEKKLDEYIEYENGTSAEDNFEYEITDGNAELDAKIIGGNNNIPNILKIPEEAQTGEYILKITATEISEKYADTEAIAALSYGTEPVRFTVKVIITEPSIEPTVEPTTEPTVEPTVEP